MIWPKPDFDYSDWGKHDPLQQNWDRPPGLNANFDLRHGASVIWKGAIESWFDDSEGAEARAEIVSTEDTGDIAEVWVWNWRYEIWTQPASYKNGKRRPRAAGDSTGEKT